MDLNGDGASKNKNLKAEKPIVSLAEAAAKINPFHLRDHLVKAVRECWRNDEVLLSYTDYFAKSLSGVSFPWVKMFNDSPLSTLVDVPLSHIPKLVYGTTRNWINMPPVKLEKFSAFVLRAFDQILLDLEAQQGGGDDSKSQVGMFVALAIVLRSKPEALTTVLPTLRENPKYQGHDKLPVTVWMMAQASKGDICLGLYSWAHNLLPLVTVSNKKQRCCFLQSMDLILQFVEEILSRPKARTILVDGALRQGKPLIPLSSFEILVRLTFPSPSARVKSTERCEAIYPLLKDVALSPGMAGSNAVKQMFTFALRSARKGIVTGNPVLAEEATSIAIWCVLESVDCFEHWDILYRENLEASVALLKKLLGQKRVSSPSYTLIVNQTMESFRRKNKRAIAEGGANCSLYKEADKYCTLISWRLFERLPLGSAMTAVVVTAASAALSVAAVAASLYLFPVV